MKRNVPLAAAGAILLAGLLWCDLASAQGSLGLGRPEQAIQPTGILAPLFMWLKDWQAWFYQLMRGELLALRTDATRVWFLAALSFGYGVFHAAGPGHGKAVISSYMIANEIAARRGIVLSFASAFLQALSAIVLIAALTVFLRGAGMRQQDATAWLEIASYGATTLLGLWLLWTKAFRGGDDHNHASRTVAAKAHRIEGHGHSAQDRGHGHGQGHAHDHAHGHDDGHRHGDHHDHECGHSHAADPAMLAGKVGLRQAWSAVAAVGLRPCTGALIVLTFAFLNGLYFAGLASVMAMALGTGLTVAALAALAVGAKDLAIRVGGAADRAAVVHRAAELIGAGFVFVIGLVLLLASVQ